MEDQETTRFIESMLYIPAFVENYDDEGISLERLGTCKVRSPERAGVETKNSVITRLATSSDEITFPKGIKVGSSQEEVKAAYGEPTASKEEDKDKESWAYIDDDYMMIIYFEQGKVSYFDQNLEWEPDFIKAAEESVEKNTPKDFSDPYIVLGDYIARVNVPLSDVEENAYFISMNCK